MFLQISTLVLAPILLIQGKSVKRNIPKLPEPQGVREGRVFEQSNQPLSILILGDSAAAGVGVDHQHEALSGAILKNLKPYFTIDWKVEAKTGNTSKDLISSISSLREHHYDVVISSVGVNDVTQLISARKWGKLQKQIYAMIQSKFTPQLILASEVPPMQMFPALPHPLRWLLGQYAKKMNLSLAPLIDAQENMQIVKYDLDYVKKNQLQMASDGFHPSQAIYSMWGKNIAEMILQKLNTSA